MNREQLLEIKAKMSNIWAKGCMSMIVSVLSDLTSQPLLGLGRKSWYIIIIIRLIFRLIRLILRCAGHGNSKMLN